VSFSSSTSSPFFNTATMAPHSLEQEDHSRDAAFNKVMHGSSAQKRGGFAAMLGKGADGQKAAVDEYFKHWDNKDAKDETPEIREVRRYGHSVLAIDLLLTP
jgi:sterol 24-C-methyltransferase